MERTEEEKRRRHLYGDKGAKFRKGKQYKPMTDGCTRTITTFSTDQLLLEKQMRKEKRHFEAGQKYGKLTLIKPVGETGTHSIWRCKCDCGNECDVIASHLGRDTNSCGCIRGIHRESKTRLYSIWCNMKARCYDDSTPQYQYYGARGITICDEWKWSYETFREWAISNGYAPNLTIDRIDNYKGYEPQNCRWATPSEQMYNQRLRGNIPYKGICLDRTGYRAQISVDGKKVYIGHSTHLMDAVIMRDEYIKKHKISAPLNLPHHDNILMEKEKIVNIKNGADLNALKKESEKKHYRYRIRKLTPRECLRLMAVRDSDIDKMQSAGISESRQYQLAGNSIVVDCLVNGIFKNLFIESDKPQLTLF